MEKSLNEYERDVIYMYQMKKRYLEKSEYIKRFREPAYKHMLEEVRGIEESKE